MPGFRNLTRTSSSSASSGVGSLPLHQANDTKPALTDPALHKKGRSPKAQSSPSISAMDSFKRHSLAAMGKSKHGDPKESRKPSPSPAALQRKSGNTIDLAVESPPAIFYGNPSQSTGALYGGQLKLTVVDPEITLSAFTMTLVGAIVARKPVVKDCADCISKTTPIKEWSFLSHPKTFTTGTYQFPFTYLFGGHLPATTMGELGRLQYFFDAKAVVLPRPNGTSTSVDTPITMRREVKVMRAIKPQDEKVSMRIFPPTNLAARVTHTPIIHPIGDNNIQMVLSGISVTNKDTITRWRLRKMNWRLEETEKMVSPACSKHASKVGGEGRGMGHEDTRVVGRDEIKSGWKTDLSSGEIAMEFVIRPSGNPRPLCDMESPTGLVVSHSLVVELIIAEEWAQIRTPERATPTGAARVLRMQFALLVTERSGMGISWDEEQPPMYEDVPDSPPMYPSDRGPPSYPGGVADSAPAAMQRVASEMVNYTGTPLGPPPAFEEDEEGFEGLTLGPSRMQQMRTVSDAASTNSTAGPSSRKTSSSGPRPGSSSSSGRGRSRLSMADFDTEEHA